MTALALLRQWKLLLGGAAIAIMGMMLLVAKMDARHWHKKYDREHAALQALVSEQVKARALAEENKRATEARYAQIQKEQSDDFKARLADARAQLWRWMRDRAAQSGGGQQADLSGHPGSAPGPDALPAAALVDVADLERCTAAVIGFEGWQRWYSEVEKAQAK